MPRFTLYLLALTTVLLISSDTIAFQAKEKVTQLDAGKTTIVIKGDEQIITMEGGIDFSHEGMTIKAEKGQLKLLQNSNKNEYTLVSLELAGSIRYSDKKGYKGSCGSAYYDFGKRILSFHNNVKIDGVDVLLKGDDVTYYISDEGFEAQGNIHHEGKTRMISLLLESKESSEIPYTIDCENILIDKKSGKAYAQNLVRFNSSSTKIECDDVEIDFSEDQIVKLTATGNVKFSDPELRAESEIAIYDKSESTLILRGGPSKRNVEVNFKGQEFSGREVIVDLSNGREITLGEGKVKITPPKNK